MNTQKVLLGTLLVQPEFAPYVLPMLDISDFEPDLQPVFAAAQGFWTATGNSSALHTVSSPESDNHGVR